MKNDQLVIASETGYASAVYADGVTPVNDLNSLIKCD